MSLLTPSLQEKRRSCAHTQPCKSFPADAHVPSPTTTVKEKHSCFTQPLQTGTRVNSPATPATRRVFLQWLCPAEKVRKNGYLYQHPAQARGRHHEDSTSKPPLASIRWGGRLMSPSLGTGEAWCRRCPCSSNAAAQQGTQGQEPQVEAHACCAIESSRVANRVLALAYCRRLRIHCSPLAAPKTRCANNNRRDHFMR